jgi:hypothetical protein
LAEFWSAIRMAMLAKQGLGQCGTRERRERKIKLTVVA